MFQSARMKLTLWYLLIIMAVSIAFSTVIFVGSTTEFNRVLKAQEYRLSHPEFRVRSLPGNIVQLQPDDVPGRIDPEVISDAKKRLLLELIGVNTVILLLSALAGYFLAGRTLGPIQVMVDEQKRFITDASHELNTPLTSLRTTIEVNLRSKDLSVQKARDVLKSNLEDVGSLQSLSEELIGMTQYEELPPVISQTKISLSEAMSDALRVVEPLAKKKKITFHREGTEGHSMADKKSITQLFVILFDNAIKYSPQGKSVFVTTEITHKKVRVSVKDEGIGIAKEDMPYIFDRFYRADKSRTKQTAPGYGLGLSIAKRIVHLHKGTIQAESEINKGTTFIVEFPVA